jgi:hypothetical protein
MKVKFGNSVKDIPKQYYGGTWLIKESDLEKPDKIRLTKRERFLFAEAAWRTKQDKLIRSHLDDTTVGGIEVQYNRSREKRYCVIYKKNGTLWTSAIVPRSVSCVCPEEDVSKMNVDF